MKIKKIIGLLLLCFMLVPSLVFADGFYKTEQIQNMVFDEELRAFRIAETLATSTTGYTISVTSTSVYSIDIPTSSIFFGFQSISDNSTSMFWLLNSTSNVTTQGWELDAGNSYFYGTEYNGPINFQGESGSPDLDIRIKQLIK